MRDEQLALPGVEPAKRRRTRVTKAPHLPTSEDARLLREWVNNETAPPGTLARALQGATDAEIMVLLKKTKRKLTLRPEERDRLLALADRWEQLDTNKEAPDAKDPKVIPFPSSRARPHRDPA